MSVSQPHGRRGGEGDQDLNPDLTDPRAQALHHSATSLYCPEQLRMKITAGLLGHFLSSFNNFIVDFNICIKSKISQLSVIAYLCFCSVPIVVAIHAGFLLSCNQDIILSLCFFYSMLFQSLTPPSDMIHTTSHFNGHKLFHSGQYFVSSQITMSSFHVPFPQFQLLLTAI